MKSMLNESTNELLITKFDVKMIQCNLPTTYEYLISENL